MANGDAGQGLAGGTVQLYTTGLGEEDLKDIFVQTVSSVEEAILASVTAHGDPEIAVVLEGPYVIPQFGGN